MSTAITCKNIYIEHHSMGLIGNKSYCDVSIVKNLVAKETAERNF